MYSRRVARPRWLRAVLSLWALWFGVAITEPAGLAACPMHSGPTGAMVDHAAHGHHHESHPSHHDHCSCLGACCACPTATLPTAPTVVVSEPQEAETVAPVARVEVPRAESSEFLHPFASGPPVVA